MAFEFLEQSIAAFTAKMNSFTEERKKFEALRDKQIMRAARIDTKIQEDEQEVIRLEQALTATKHRIGLGRRNANDARKKLSSYEIALNAFAYAAAETKRHLDMATESLVKPPEASM